MKSWRSPKMTIGASLISGQGNIAIADIKKDEILAVRSGHIVALTEALKLVPSLGYVFLQLSNELALSPLNADEVQDICCFWNHSCNANVGMRGDVCFVAMKDIPAGQELCIDYATIAAHPLEINCTCKNANCRKKISGEDWKRLLVKEEYTDFIAPN